MAQGYLVTSCLHLIQNHKGKVCSTMQASVQQAADLMTPVVNRRLKF